MTVAEALIRSIDWSQFRIATGAADDVGERLSRLLRSGGAEESQAAWRSIENSLFSQDEIFDAAEPAIDVILASLVEERPTYVKALLLDLLFLLLNGASESDRGLSERCRERTVQGYWLLVREALTGPQWVRDAVLEVLDLVDEGRARELRTWLEA